MTSRAWLALALLVGLMVASSALADERITKDEQGNIRVKPLPTDERFLNPWTDELEAGFWQRANLIIKQNASGGGYGSTYFENEKRSYPAAMISFLAGHREAAIKFLQGRDANAGEWHKHTLGIDYYACFTLKQQMRKYFFFGEYLDKDYRATMKKAAKVWTEKDPLRRPHYAYKRGSGGWTPQAKNSWVDTRTTDNLHGMRIVSIYLMAEEAGNEETRKLYKERLQRTVRKMFEFGMGEWDSENYHGHTMTAYIQLYDFAKDPEVKLLGKAAMDYLCAVGAFKYYRGAFCGPIKRDYNKPIVHAGSAADHLGLYFGDWAINPEHTASDNVHFITSAYRPPLAVVGLARKQFERPCEVFVTHPPYPSLRRDEDEQPEWFETMFFGHTYQFGTLARGSGHADVNGFKLVAENSKRGADFFVANSTSDPLFIGSPKYHDKHHVGGNNVAQYRNLAVWLNPKGDTPFVFQVPKSAKVMEKDGVWFVAMEKTWIALSPINLKVNGIDKALTERINFEVKRNKDKVEKQPRWPDEQVISAKGKGGKFSGFAVEVGEAKTHGDFDTFRANVLKKAKLDVSELDKGMAGYTGVEGKSVKIVHGGMPSVWRDGKAYDWKQHEGAYQPADGGKAPIHATWGSGRLRIEADGHVFEGVVEDGKYRFTNTRADR